MRNAKRLTARSMQDLLDSARARIAAGWRVEAVHPDGLTMSKAAFGRVTQVRIATDKHVRVSR